MTCGAGQGSLVPCVGVCTNVWSLPVLVQCTIVSCLFWVLQNFQVQLLLWLLGFTGKLELFKPSRAFPFWITEIYWHCGEWFLGCKIPWGCVSSFNKDCWPLSNLHLLFALLQLLTESWQSQLFASCKRTMILECLLMLFTPLFFRSMFFFVS